MRKLLAALAVALMFMFGNTGAVTAKDASPVFGNAKVQTLSKAENQKVVGKGYYADYYGSYGDYYASIAQSYSYYGWYYSSYSNESYYYANAAAYAAAAYYAYYYAWYYAGY